MVVEGESKRARFPSGSVFRLDEVKPSDGMNLKMKRAHNVTRSVDRRVESVSFSRLQQKPFQHTFDVFWYFFAREKLKQCTIEERKRNMPI